HAQPARNRAQSPGTQRRGLRAALPAGEGDAHRPRALAAKLMADDTQTIEFWPCRYEAPCHVHDCKLKATTIARTVDAQGRPHRQYEVCSVHADYIAQREMSRGREVVRLGVGR